MGDYHQIDNDENNKDKNTDREIAGNYKLAKRLDNLACRVRAFVTAAQHNVGGSHVQPQPQTVAISKSEGKLEKSSGRNVLIATIRIRSDTNYC